MQVVHVNGLMVKKIHIAERYKTKQISNISLLITVDNIKPFSKKFILFIS